MAEVPRWRRYLRLLGCDTPADIGDELRFHLEAKQRDLIRKGLPPSDARDRASRTFGDFAEVRRLCLDIERERIRKMDWNDRLATFRQDLRHAARRLRHSPGFTVAAIAILALGIGVNTAIFTVVRDTLIRSLPYRDAARLCWVWVTNPRQGYDRDITSYPRLQDWRAQSTTFESFTWFTGSSLPLTGVDNPEQLRGAAVAANFFEVLGAAPLLGRTFTTGEDETGRENVIVLSHTLWMNRYAGDAGILGRSLMLDGRAYQVIGVAPPSLKFPDREVSYWLPLTISQQAQQARGNYWLRVIGRLKPGASVPVAQADMSGLAKRLEARYREDRDLGVLVVGLQEELTREIRPALLLLMAAAVCVFLIATANVTGMLAARAAERQRDVAVRAALGAGRARLIQQLLAENLSLFALGGAAALIAGFAGIRLLKALSPPSLAQIQDSALDASMIATTLAISIAAGLLFGLRPAFEGARADLAVALASGSRGVAGRGLSHRFRKVLVTVQVALSVVLLLGGALLVRSFAKLQSVDLGFDTNITMAQIGLPRSRYPQGAQAVQVYENLIARLAARPGTFAAASSSIFLGRLPNSAGFTIEGRSEQIDLPLTIDAVTPSFFHTMRIPLRAGRLFNEHDRPEGPRVALINETTARRHWANQDPIGQRFKFGGPQSTGPWLTIVGVVADTRRAGVEYPVFTESYLPLAQSPRGGMTVVVRGADAAAAIRSELRALDAQLPVPSPLSMETALGRQAASRRFSTILVGLFAATALLLAVVGLYGILAHFVAVRSRELGIRIAVGAGRREIIGVVLRYGLSVLIAGVVMGAIAAAFSVRLVANQLFGVKAWDPVALAVVAGALAIAAIAASVLPAWKATRIDPLVTLRSE